MGQLRPSFRASGAKTLLGMLPLLLPSACVLEAHDPAEGSFAGQEAALLRGGYEQPSFPTLPAQPGTEPPEPPGPPVYEPDPDDPRACSQELYQRLYDPEVRVVEIDCNLRLPAGFETTSRMVVRGSTSNIVIECNGARFNGGPGTPNGGRDMIAVHSDEVPTDGPVDLEDREWMRPENIRIQDCEIVGSVRVWGISEYSNDRAVPVFKESSLHGSGALHTRRARLAAPRRIVFDNVHIEGVSRIPLYLSPGVTELTFENGVIDGRGSSVAIYLDAETAYNTLRHNTIQHTSFGDRELIALDGSSHNTIVDNDFAALESGGIFLYRNCGEGGIIRVTAPTHNYIVNNTFYYRDYRGPQPSIFLGSRNGDPPGFELFGWHTYCNDEDGHGYGSSASDRDHATENVVMRNQIIGRLVSEMIRSRGSASSLSKNFVGLNVAVPSRDDIVARHAGCYVPFQSRDYDVDRSDFAGDFLPHGGTIAAPTWDCASGSYLCREGDLGCVYTPPRTSAVSSPPAALLR